MLHFAVHYISSPNTKWFKSKKVGHMKHYYLRSETELAVTSPYRDRIYTTF
jgi:hypothetical protein